MKQSLFRENKDKDSKKKTEAIDKTLKLMQNSVSQKGIQPTQIYG